MPVSSDTSTLVSAVTQKVGSRFCATSIVLDVLYIQGTSGMFLKKLSATAHFRTTYCYSYLTILHTCHCYWFDDMCCCAHENL